MRIILSLLILAILSGCASTPKGKQFSGSVEGTNEKATVYIFRKSAFPGSVRDTNVFIDGKAVIALQNGTYDVAYLDEGAHKIGVKNIPGWQYVEGQYLEIETEVSNGEIYFIMFTKKFDVSSDLPEDVVLISAGAGINTGILEGGLLDSNEIIGLVGRDYGISELKKTKKTGLQVDPQKI